MYNVVIKFISTFFLFLLCLLPYSAIASNLYRVTLNVSDSSVAYYAIDVTMMSSSNAKLYKECEPVPHPVPGEEEAVRAKVKTSEDVNRIIYLWINSNHSHSSLMDCIYESYDSNPITAQDFYIESASGVDNSIAFYASQFSSATKPIDTSLFSISIVNALDADDDGLPDDYENSKYYLDMNDSEDASFDKDNDGSTNLEEYLAGTDPDDSNSFPDADNDGLPDSYEDGKAFLDKNNPNDALLDEDNDGFTNLEEYLAGTYLDYCHSKPETTPPEFNPVLLIDAQDPADPTVRKSYTDALDALGVTYEVWDIINKGEPSSSKLDSYGSIIWFSEGENDATDTMEAKFASRLDGGACLILHGQDYAYINDSTVRLTPFMKNYLGVNSIDQDHQLTVSGDPIIGIPDGPFEDLSCQYDLEGFDNSDYLVPTESAGSAMATDTPVLNHVGLFKDGGNYKTIFFAFPFSALTGGNEDITSTTALNARKDVLQKSLEFCGVYDELVRRKASWKAILPFILNQQ